MDKYSTRNFHTGRQIPVLGLGTWQLSNETTETILYAIELGYRLIDTSSDYHTHPEIGKAINKTDLPREDLFITTKVEETDDAYSASREYTAEMDIKHADLIVIHRPPRTGAGVELWEGLIKAKKEGITRDIGVSNYGIDQMETLIEETGEVPVINQIEWSPFGFSKEMLDYGKEKGIIIEAYSPLTRTKRFDNEQLNKIAAKYEKSPAQILIRWNLQKGTIPIPKANKESHLQENLNVFDFELDKEDMEDLDDLNEHYSSLGSLAYV